MKKVYGILFVAGLFAFASCSSDNTTGVEETTVTETTVEETTFDHDMTVDTTGTAVDTTETF